MSDRELLELAAKAAGIKVVEITGDGTVWQKIPSEICRESMQAVIWNPLTDDGDALRLAVKLNLDIRYSVYDAGIAVIVGGAYDTAPEAVHEIFEVDGSRATRRAIVRAAAEIGSAMQ